MFFTGCYTVEIQLQGCFDRDEKSLARAPVARPTHTAMPFSAKAIWHLPQGVSSFCAV